VAGRVRFGTLQLDHIIITNGESNKSNIGSVHLLDRFEPGCLDNSLNIVGNEKQIQYGSANQCSLHAP
jgi:hypothetical protein